MQDLYELLDDTEPEFEFSDTGEALYETWLRLEEELCHLPNVERGFLVNRILADLEDM